MKPRLLDAFCGAGGCTKGYQRAGFYVVGVDINEQPNYCGDEFIEDDALGCEDLLLSGDFDAVSASPPCQRYSTATLDHSKHPDLYEPTRALLEATGLPYVIENVVGSPYRSGILLCGSMFGLQIRRHRNFETSFMLMRPQCDHSGPRPYTITGHLHNTEQDFPHSLKPTREHALELMGTPWMTWQECVLAIPPVYTEWLGARLLEHINARQLLEAP